VKEPFNVNSLAQTAAMAALDDKAHLRKTLQMVSAGRKMLSHELEALGLRVVDTATNFILTDLGRASSTVYEKLLRKGIIVRPMAAWGLGTFIRVTIGKPAENKRFITELKHIIC